MPKVKLTFADIGTPSPCLPVPASSKYLKKLARVSSTVAASVTAALA